MDIDQKPGAISRPQTELVWSKIRINNLTASIKNSAEKNLPHYFLSFERKSEFEIKLLICRWKKRGLKL